jgi:orotidine-5'-phosphate decarboxylase
VNPYLGSDTLQPFIDVARDRRAGIYVLVRTSNPGAGTFQDHGHEGSLMYRKVAETVEELSAATCDEGAYGLVGAVIGATYPRELTDLREIMPHVPLLVPGYGSQGGGATDVAGGFDASGLGAIVNNSRGINFAYTKEPYDAQFGPDRWEEAAEAATLAMIADLAKDTSAGKLQSEAS